MAQKPDNINKRNNFTSGSVAKKGDIDYPISSDLS